LSFFSLFSFFRPADSSVVINCCILELHVSRELLRGAWLLYGLYEFGLSIQGGRLRSVIIPLRWAFAHDRVEAAWQCSRVETKRQRALPNTLGAGR
jgi:hypothetical protein